MWYAVIDIDKKIIANGYAEDGVPVPDSVLLSEFAAPNPVEHEISQDATGLWRVVLREAPLAELHASATFRLNKAIGGARQRFITDIPGQSDVYVEKQLQASRFLEQLEASGHAPDGAFPLVVSAAEARDITQTESATLILQKKTQYNHISAMLESIRESGNRRITDAQSEAAVEAALAVGRQDIDDYLNGIT